MCISVGKNQDLIRHFHWPKAHADQRHFRQTQPFPPIKKLNRQLRRLKRLYSTIKAPLGDGDFHWPWAFPSTISYLIGHQHFRTLKVVVSIKGTSVGRWNLLPWATGTVVGHRDFRQPQLLPSATEISVGHIDFFWTQAPPQAIAQATGSNVTLRCSHPPQILLP